MDAVSYRSGMPIAAKVSNRPRGYRRNGSALWPVVMGVAAMAATALLETASTSRRATIEDREARISDLETQIRELDDEAAGEPFTPETKERWNTLNTELEAERTVLGELQARAARVTAIAGNPDSGAGERGVPEFNLNLKVEQRGDIYDLTTIRSSVADPESARVELMERAKIAVDRDFTPSHPNADETRAHAAIDRLLGGGEDLDGGRVAEHILRTGSRAYRRAFWRGVMGQVLTSDDQRLLASAERALTVGTGAASAGLAVPYTLDPTVIPTYDGTINPMRSVARVVQITGLEWRGVSSGAVTATRRAEEAETTDNAPTLAGPSRQVSRVDAFIPYSFEAGMDWPALESEMARLIQDAKDIEEGTSFYTGNGTLPNPQGVLTGTTNTINATTGQTFDLEDLYRLSGALPPAYRGRGRYMADLLVANLTRQFDTAGGAALWARLGEGTPDTLLGKPFHEASGMPDSAATGNKFFLFGDFGRYVIVDRIGMQIETVQHVVGTNHRPTGQRGLLAFWRNNAFVVDANAFRALLGIA